MKELIVIAIFSLLNFTGYGQGIKGQVVNKKKDPLINADVIVYQNGVLKGKTITDYDGKYTIKPLDTGCYNILVSYIGCDTGKTTGILVVPNQMTIWNFQLKGINCQAEIRD
ncbi:MAG: Carboxypeptidase regulatory-like domain [Flavipsychrobacter sp.]|jgi:hypothetical protein|nr:Carboxypeptidase regulatory-like domain [Flavipsychrobacter sp.]